MEETNHPVDDFLEHVGVKGMKWGVRRSSFTGKVKARATMAPGARKTIAKNSGLADQSAKYKRAYNRTYRHAAKRIRQGVRAINNDPIYKGVSFKRDTPLRRQYYDRVSKMATAQLNASSIKKGKMGNNLELKFDFNISTQMAPTVTIVQRDTYGGRRDTRKGALAERQAVLGHSDILQHADDRILYGTVTLDEFGLIKELVFPEMTDEEIELADSEAEEDDELVQSNLEFVTNTLKHQSSSESTYLDLELIKAKEFISGFFK